LTQVVVAAAVLVYMEVKGRTVGKEKALVECLVEVLVVLRC